MGADAGSHAALVSEVGLHSMPVTVVLGNSRSTRAADAGHHMLHQQHALTCLGYMICTARSRGPLQVLIGDTMLFRLSVTCDQ